MLQIVLYAVVIIAILIVIIVTCVARNKTKKLNKISEVLYELLPQLDCKECGRENCIMFADDLEKGKTSPSKCPYLVGKNYLRCRQILKKERNIHFDSVAFVKCKGGYDCENKFEYVGDKTCHSNDALHSGDKVCPFACLGCGDCIKACQYDAITISPKGCAVIDSVKCIGCGECVNSCPNHLIELIPSEKFVDVVCSNSSSDSLITRNCNVACTHCEACVVACPEGAIKMVGGLPKIDEKKCTKCGKCVAVCPTHVISRL